MNGDKSGTMFGRGDVESVAGRDLTDDEWVALKNTYEWRKGLPDRLTEHGWGIIASALAAAGIKKEEKCGSDEPS